MSLNFQISGVSMQVNKKKIIVKDTEKGDGDLWKFNPFSAEPLKFTLYCLNMIILLKSMLQCWGK